MRKIYLYLVLVLVFTSCSKHTIDERIIHDKPPVIVEKPITGIIPKNVIKKAELKYGPYVRVRYESYNKKLLQLQNASTQTKLKEINVFFNKVPYSDDIKVWGVRDYWATPLEFLGRDKGDCEDYVIAKYFALRDLGIESEKLYFAYVKSINFTRTHMVLSYFSTPYSMPLVLDSVNFKIFPAYKRKDLIPIYNFNGESLYQAKRDGKNGPKVRNHEKVHKKWDRLLEDIKRNKF